MNALFRSTTIETDAAEQHAAYCPITGVSIRPLKTGKKKPKPWPGSSRGHNCPVSPSRVRNALTAHLLTAKLLTLGLWPALGRFFPASGPNCLRRRCRGSDRGLRDTDGLLRRAHAKTGLGRVGRLFIVLFREQGRYQTQRLDFLLETGQFHFLLS